ncbi:MAG TPA: TonB-dependent receptor [Nitrospirales bacterium]|nr:TonB-dependent receptor [Nitrospirales bacterium]
MKQLPSVCLWKRSVRRFVLLLSVPLVFGVSPSTFAASAGLSTSSPPSQEILLQQQQELEGELEDVNNRLEEIRQQLRELQRIPVTHQTDEQRQTQAALQEEEVVTLEEMSIVSTRIQKRPEGLAVSSTLQSETESQPTRTMKESLESLPGVVLRQANGPRDFSISIRGSGVKTSFAVRDIKVYEDGFIQTQSDGLSRLDIHDPWFMRSTEVIRGAASSLYDNYALGGMAHFRTRRGSDINGVETFFSGGSFGYHKEAVAIGQQFKNVDISLFASNVAEEEGYIKHSDYNTQTLNFNFRFNIDEKQSLYVKAITNWLDTRVPTRLTKAQFQADPRQAGSLSVARNQQRIDRRTIVGAIYERELTPNTVLTMEVDYDVKDINQYFFQIFDNVNTNIKHYTDLRHHGRIFSMPLQSYLGFFVNNMEQEGNTFQNLGDGQGTRGTLAANNRGTIRNIGGRFREELTFLPNWTLAAGLGFEQSIVSIQTINYDNAGAVDSRADATRTFYNWAPEMSLTWRPEEGFRHWVRGSTGYGIPTFGNLTRNPLTGLPGSNFDLKPQKNVNVEIGTESRLHKTFTVQLAGFWTFFRDEIITQNVFDQSTTASTNADSSEYRGVEVAADWRPLPGWRFSGAYTHIDARYINFTDRYLVNGIATDVIQDGKKVPNVPRDILNMKAAYDHFETGWGGWVETNYSNSYFLNNGNTVGIPSFWVVNLNLHKTFQFKNDWVRFATLYFEIDNLADKTYAASGQVVSDATPDASKQLFFAGYGRAFYGGVTLGLF